MEINEKTDHFIKNAFVALNVEQQLAVNTIDGPVLVLAGAGTGKTRVLTSRIAHIFFSCHSLPEQILSVTFTNKAANEMRERIKHLIGSDVLSMWLGTFHSIGVRILRIYYSAIGLNSNFIIADESDKAKIIKQIAQELEIDEKKYPLKLLMSIISTLKEKIISHTNESEVMSHCHRSLNLVPLYRTYQETLMRYNMVDFDDLIFQVVNMLLCNADILLEMQNRFKYILVDEYQDTSHGQHRLLLLLAGKQCNICCVGDEDQSIYSWRGAEVSNIMNFESNFPGAKIVRLEKNYRSTGNILHIATTLISTNKSRYGKVLHSAQESGEQVKIYGVYDDAQEARKMIAVIKDYVSRDKIAFSDIAILVRTSFQMRSLEDAFIRNEVPYRIVDGVKFYDRKEIKDIIAYLRFIYSFSDYVAFARVVNLPKRGIGDKTVELIRKESSSMNNDLISTLDHMISNQDFSPKISETLSHFVRNVRYWKDCMDSNELNLSDFTEMVAHQSGYIQMLQLIGESDKDEMQRLDNVQEFIASISAFRNVIELLEHVALFNSKDSGNTGNDVVSIMTMHAAKGLEFNMVILPGWEEGMFPSYRALDENCDAGLEEERRLAYVAITRAKKYLTILYAGRRFIYGKWQNSIKSRFISEILQDANKQSIVHMDVNASENNHNDRYLNQSTRSAQSFTSSHFFENKYDKNSYLENDSRNHNNDLHVSDNMITNQSSFISENKRAGIVDRSIAMNGALKAGDAVSHDRFGAGLVSSLMGHFIEVRFEDGIKRLIQKNFLKKA